MTIILYRDGITYELSGGPHPPGPNDLCARIERDYFERREKMKPTLQLIGEDGNAFMMIAKARRVLKKNGATDDEIRAFTEDAESGDYDHVLAVLAKHFEII